MIVHDLIKAIRLSGNNKDRANQTSIGPSEVGGCRRQLWYRLHNQEVTNPDTLQFPAMYGTAIHAQILEAFKYVDPFHERFYLEQEWYDADTDIRGHIDCFDKERGEVIDWKSTKKTNLRFFPSRQQRWQVQLYGYLLKKAGHEVNAVTLVAIPRDGDERDIVYHSEPYDQQVVDEALAWLNEVKSSTAMPPADKDVALCQNYCRFYDATGLKGCTARGKAEAATTIIEDLMIDTAAKRYLEVISQMNELEIEKDSLRTLFEGISGVTASGVKVQWSVTAGRKSIDESAVKEALGYVPYKEGNPSTRLSVKS
jgi:hypothetical protein